MTALPEYKEKKKKKKKKGEREVLTIRMPHPAQKPHCGRAQGIIFRELELGGEYPAFVGCALGALDQGFPEEEVVFGDGAGGDTVGWRGGQGFVFHEEAFGGDCGGHFCAKGAAMAGKGALEMIGSGSRGFGGEADYGRMTRRLVIFREIVAAAFYLGFSFKCIAKAAWSMPLFQLLLE